MSYVSVWPHPRREESPHRQKPGTRENNQEGYTPRGLGFAWVETTDFNFKLPRSLGELQHKHRCGGTSWIHVFPTVLAFLNLQGTISPEA